MPVLHGKVVVDKSAGAVRLQGAPRLVAEPEDFAEYYIAEHRIAQGSLPDRLRRLPGSAVRLLESRGECDGTLGPISLWAWADEQGSGWKRHVPQHNARRALREGDVFLVADLETECELRAGDVATLADTTNYRAWTIRSWSEKSDDAANASLVAKALAALAQEPGLATQNAAYERYRSASKEALPKHWWSLPASYVYWSYATSETGAPLLIAELHSRATSGDREFTGA